MSKKKRKSISPELAQEIEEWEEYLLADLRERIVKNKGEALSERQLKKTMNGDATYERMVRVVGRGNPERLRQVMMRMVQEVQGAHANSERFESAGCFEESEHFEVAKSFEESEVFEAAGSFEKTECFESAEHFEKPNEKPKRQKWNGADLLVFLRGKCRELGRVPTSTEVATWSKAKLCPSYPTCMKLLGVKSKAEWGKILL